MGEGQQAAVHPARTYATVAGGGLIFVGLLGFFYSADFGRGEALVAERALGVFYVNGWLNLLHLAVGSLGLLMAMRAARLYCLGAAVLWLVLAGGGFFGAHGGESVPAMGGLIPAGTANNLLNLALAGLGFAALAASPAGSPKPRRKAKSKAKIKPKVKPESRASKPGNARPGAPETGIADPGDAKPGSGDAGSGIGRPRSARPSGATGRRPIN